jgi:anti-sigma factor RsiW
LDGLNEIDALLGVILEGTSEAADRERFLALVELDTRFTADLKERAKNLLATEDVDLDLCQELLLALTEGDGWDDVSEAIRQDLGFDAEVTGDVLDSSMVDSVMSAVEALTTSAALSAEDKRGQMLSRLVDGELSESERIAFTAEIATDDSALRALSDHADLGRLIRESLNAKVKMVDFAPMWVEVSKGIGMESPEHVEGWATVGAAIRQVVQEAANLSVEQKQEMSSAVMSEVERLAANDTAAVEFELALREAKKPRRSWFSFLPHAVAFAGVAAAVLVAPMLGSSDIIVDEDTFEMEYAEVDLAEMETLEYASDVLVQVIMDVEGDGPLIIFVDEDIPQGGDEEWDDADWGDDWGDDEGWDTAGEAI